ncbi:hypothetical protein GpartN1_g6057.t1 [Galdieria partita]|uniref:ARID domain-containing protein n=1 Tax=Galdieria partita TaxID=83374 RepID=A0A9C7Q2G7_9RHOD|nr:hypothetical protein GpartN1_g6057.t1 [Galdieria partita]
MNQQEGILETLQREYKGNHLYLPYTGWTLQNSYGMPTPAYSYYPFYLINAQKPYRKATCEGYVNYPMEYRMLHSIPPPLYSEENQPISANQICHNDLDKENNICLHSKDEKRNEDIRAGNISPCSVCEKSLEDFGHTNNNTLEPIHELFEECSNCSTTSSGLPFSTEEMKSKGNQRAVENMERNAPSNLTLQNTHLDSEVEEERQFYQALYELMSKRGQPILRLPTLGFKELDLFRLFKEVTSRGGVDYVIAKKQWKEVADALGLPSSCTDSGFRLRLHYIRYLEPYERVYFTPPPDVINSLFKYRGRKLGNLYGNPRTKHHTNRKKCTSKFSSIERHAPCTEVTECKNKLERRREPCNMTSPKRRKYSDRKLAEQSSSETKQMNNSLEASTVFQVESGSYPVKSSEMDNFLISSPNGHSKRDKSLRIFDHIGERSLMRYIDRYLNEHCSEWSNLPRQKLIHMAEEHFQSMNLSPSEETETLLNFLQVVAYDNI